MRDLPQKSLLGLDSMAMARNYPAWFSESTGYLQVVLGTCQSQVMRTAILTLIKPHENLITKIHPVSSLFVHLRINSDQSDLMFGWPRVP
jgi:hypothetical protein